MREIKFRAWNGKEMRYDVNINDGKPVRKGYQWFNEENDVYNSELMQFTGLLDKNGKEIYEGDIIKYSGNSRIWEIYFDTENLQFRMKSTDKGAKIETVHKYAFHELGTIEIIGNIYENPELLSN